MKGKARAPEDGCPWDAEFVDQWDGHWSDLGTKGGHDMHMEKSNAITKILEISPELFGFVSIFHWDQRNREAVKLAEGGKTKEAVALVNPLFGLHNAKVIVRVVHATWRAEVRAPYQFRLRWFGDTETFVYDLAWQQQLWGDHSKAHAELTAWLHSFEVRREQSWIERNALLTYQAVRGRMRSPELTQWFLNIAQKWLNEAESTGAHPMHMRDEPGAPFYVAHVLDSLILGTLNRLELESRQLENLAETREARWARLSPKTAQNIVTAYLARAGLKRTIADKRVKFGLK